MKAIRKSVLKKLLVASEKLNNSLRYKIDMLSRNENELIYEKNKLNKDYRELLLEHKNDNLKSKQELATALAKEWCILKIK